jgi:hypothetical protein
MSMTEDHSVHDDYSECGTKSLAGVAGAIVTNFLLLPLLFFLNQKASPCGMAKSFGRCCKMRFEALAAYGPQL